MLTKHSLGSLQGFSHHGRRHREHTSLMFSVFCLAGCLTDADMEVLPPPLSIGHSCTCARDFWMATSPLWPQGSFLIRTWKRPKQADVAKWEMDFVWFGHNHSQFLNNFIVYNLPPAPGLSSWSYHWFSPDLSIPPAWTSRQKTLCPSASIDRDGRYPYCCACLVPVLAFRPGSFENRDNLVLARGTLYLLSS